MTTVTSVGSRVRALLLSRTAVRFTRYTGSSVIAVGIAQLTMLLVYVLWSVPAGRASLVAFIAGAIPKYILNHAWAWGRHRMPRLGREVLPYAAIVAASAALTALMTGAADRSIPHLVESDSLRVTLVQLTFLFANGLMFVVKFVLFDQLVFRDRFGKGGRPRKRKPTSGRP